MRASSSTGKCPAQGGIAAAHHRHRPTGTFRGQTEVRADPRWPTSPPMPRRGCASWSSRTGSGPAPARRRDRRRTRWSAPPRRAPSGCRSDRRRAPPAPGRRRRAARRCGRAGRGATPRAARRGSTRPVGGVGGAAGATARDPPALLGTYWPSFRAHGGPTVVWPAMRLALDPSTDVAAYRFHHQVRVRFAETDAMGVVHHAAYLPYLEEARVAWLREIGHPYDSVRAEGVDFGVLEAFVQYRRALRFDEVVDVHLALGGADPHHVPDRLPAHRRGRGAGHRRHRARGHGPDRPPRSFARLDLRAEHRRLTPSAPYRTEWHGSTASETAAGGAVQLNTPGLDPVSSIGGPGLHRRRPR